MARRPLLISMRRPRSFFSGEAFFVKPTGSQRSRGTGCGILYWSPASGEVERGTRPACRPWCSGRRRRRLREELEEADEEDDLPLARLRDLVPELGRRLGGVVARDVDGQLDAVGVEACGNQFYVKVDGIVASRRYRRDASSEK